MLATVTFLKARGVTLIRDGKPANYSGEGNTIGNLLAVTIPVILFIVGLYMFNFLGFYDVWIPMLGVIVLTSLAYFIPKQLIGRSNTVDDDFVTDPAHATKSPNM